MFPILKLKINGKPLVYLDNAATTQKLASVIEKEKEYYENTNANVHRSIHYLGEKATEEYELTREKVAQLINAGTKEVVFTTGATAAINVVARGVESLVDENSVILLTEMEHHANLVPWQELAKRKGARLEFVKVTKNGELDLSDLKQKLTTDVVVFAFTHVSNVLGTINPVKELCRLAKAKGAITVVDGAQAIAHLPVDVKEMGCDFYVFSGHKMYGPTGTGVLYGKKELLELLEPSTYGGEMIREVTFTKSTWNEIPYKFEAGTPNIAGIVALSKAVDFVSKLDFKKERKKEKQITDFILKEMNNISQVRTYGPKDRCAIVTFTVADLHAHDVAQMLNTQGIAVRAGHHCTMPLHSLLDIPASIRVSFATYNTIAEAKYFISALKQIAKSKADYKNENPIEKEDLTENSEALEYYYRNQTNRGTLLHARSATDKNPLCGDELTVHLKVNNDKITEAKFEGTGCAISQAAANALCEKIIDMPSAKVNTIRLEELQKMLGVKLGVVRSKCAELSIKVVNKAIKGD